MWLAFLPQLFAASFAVAIAYLIGGRDALPVGVLAYLGYSIGSRQLIPKYHRQGIALVKSQRFSDAIGKFQSSFDFFERHPWIDRYRSIVLMSPSAVGYREMALLNIAFCHGQLGAGEQSRECYQKCLDRFPGSGVAAAALRMFDSVKSAG